MRKLMLALGMAAIATPAVIVLPATSAQAQRHYSKGHHRHYAYKEWRGRDGRRYCRKSDGTVGTVVAGKRGSRELDVNYSYGKRHITVPASVPVVQIGPGKREMIKVGTPVFMVVQKTPNGLMAGSVSVGENGAKPPM